jgi:hypothetical protein
MTGKIAPKDNSSNMKNANKGTSGTNQQYDQAQGNRGTQMTKTPQNSSTGGKPPGKK